MPDAAAPSTAPLPRGWLRAAQAPFLIALTLVLALWLAVRPPQLAGLAALWACACALLALGERAPAALTDRVVLLGQVVVLDRFYRLIMQYNRWRGAFWDDTFLAADRAVFGGWPLDLGNQTSHLGAEAWALAYGTFIPLLFGTLLWFALASESRGAARFFVGLTSVYGISYLGYLAFPTMGPYALPLHAAPIPGGPIFAFVHGGIRELGSCGDAFPSLHTAAVVYIAGHARLFGHKRFYLLLPLGVAIVTATLFMRMHYLVDLIAGAAVGLAGLRICTRLPAPLER